MHIAILCLSLLFVSLYVRMAPLLQIGNYSVV